MSRVIDINGLPALFTFMPCGVGELRTQRSEVLRITVTQDWTTVDVDELPGTPSEITQQTSVSFELGPIAVAEFLWRKQQGVHSGRCISQPDQNAVEALLFGGTLGLIGHEHPGTTATITAPRTMMVTGRAPALEMGLLQFNNPSKAHLTLSAHRLNQGGFSGPHTRYKKGTPIRMRGDTSPVTGQITYLTLESRFPRHARLLFSRYSSMFWHNPRA